MNCRSICSKKPLIAIAVSVWVCISGTWVFAQDITSSVKYKECTGLIGSNPADALRFADDWLLRENTPSARHCRALALFSSKRYREAATELEQLSAHISQDNRTLWSNILRQASQAWMQAGQSSRAIAALTRAILVTSEDAFSNSALAHITKEMLMERSALYLREGQPMDAIQDLDNAVALGSDDTRLRLARAKLFIAMKELSLAKDDLQTILAAHPKHPEATALMARVE